jgi:phosphoribosylglycinamide formyltransferase 1
LALNHKHLKKRTAVLISGRGSNLAALIAAAREPDYPADIALVVSNRPDAGGLNIAAASNVHSIVIDHSTFGSKVEFEAAIDTALREADIDLVCLAGFMRILSPEFVDSWRDRVLNIHPSLLPLFPGLNTYERVIASGAKEHGATVHVVRAETDQGPIVAQARVPIAAGDTPKILAARVIAEEHRLYPLALKLIAGRQATIVGETVVFENDKDREAALGGAAAPR